ncbi:hypothetical protein M758_12G190500 [Ceratodon purpureus]|uniref:Uncharacterized protein n=1 Tax=Ceratodon purpureus TaxID=3225 RepID=A0A8T0GBD0_CERPU|nr:hypothetical protein KC19_12G186700 [Ceratodon purpureus]KAG0555665.1 hypothetical protein KC19_12G186800 [Ceratodon purpureus]KAG0599950.1 hypothetical protein M758_12G190400 [Ceratodon purpureus]KAG0599951.1 hypothetical protein M758_12G190500 [Ceratodon purpureus]
MCVGEGSRGHQVWHCICESSRLPGIDSSLVPPSGPSGAPWCGGERERERGREGHGWGARRTGWERFCVSNVVGEGIRLVPGVIAVGYWIGGLGLWAGGCMETLDREL